MRHWIFSLPLLLGGCLSAPEQAMVNACLADGTDPAICECTRAETKAHMSEKAFKAVTLTAQKRDAEAEAVFATLSEKEQMAMVNAMFASLLKCMPEAPDA